MAAEACQLLLAEPGIGAAYTRQELDSNSRTGAPFFEQMRYSWHSEVSGDLQFVVKLNWMITGSAAATHGSPHAFDTHVPLLVYGPKWVKPGRIDTPVEMVSLAPTLAQWLGVARPQVAEAEVLPVPKP